MKLAECRHNEVSLVGSEVRVTLELVQTGVALHWNQRNLSPVYLVQTQLH